jgi:hypoxanthine phosphoribosyltransferase
MDATEIASINKSVAQNIDSHYSGKKEVVAIIILKGGYVFGADLLRLLEADIPVYFIQLSSYVDTKSSGEVAISQVNLPELTDKHVLIIEDIIETGLSMETLLKQPLFNDVASIELCTLLLKPTELKANLDVKFVGKSIPSDFVVGYGLDYNEYGRHLQDIYHLRKGK